MRSVCLALVCAVLLGVFFGCGNGRGRVQETVMLQNPSEQTEVVRRGSAAELSGDLAILGILVEDAEHDWPAAEAERAAALLLEAADFLAAQAREAGGALTCRVQGAADGLTYAGDLCPAGEDGMLLNAAAEAFLDAGGEGAGAQTAYLLLVNAPGEGYALPQLSAGETELFREKAVVFCRDATPAEVAALLARLFAPGDKVFSGAALSPEGDFTAEFRAYLAGREFRL